MTAVFSAPLSAQKPIDALCAEVREVCEILRETRLQLGMLNRTEDRFGKTDFVRSQRAELELRESNCLTLLGGLRGALIYELESVEGIG